MFVFFASTAYALELPEGVKDYYKDKVSSAPGKSEGVGPTEKPKTQQGVDVGRRDTKEYDFKDESSSALVMKAWEELNKKDEDAVMAYTSRCIELYEDKAKDQEAELDGFAPAGSEENYQYFRYRFRFHGYSPGVLKGFFCVYIIRLSREVKECQS